VSSLFCSLTILKKKPVSPFLKPDSPPLVLAADEPGDEKPAVDQPYAALMDSLILTPATDPSPCTTSESEIIYQSPPEETQHLELDTYQRRFLALLEEPSFQRDTDPDSDSDTEPEISETTDSDMPSNLSSSSSSAFSTLSSQ
jgi:hypothetical protein